MSGEEGGARGVPQRPRAISRRGFLRTSGFAALGLGLAGVFTGHWRPRFPERGHRFLSDRQATTLRAVAETFLPEAEGFPTVAEVGLISRIDRALGDFHPTDRQDLLSLLSLMEFGAPLLGGGLGFFSALGPTARRELLAGWETSRVAFKRTAQSVLKALIMAYYYDDPRTWGAMGYEGPPPAIAARADV